MTTQQIADRVVALNREGDYKTIYNEFYTDETVSVENWGPTPERYVGIDAIRAKAEQWEKGVEEVRETHVSDALVSDNSFAIVFTMDVSFTEESGMKDQSGKMSELAVYHVRDGKIVHEEFCS